MKNGLVSHFKGLKNSIGKKHTLVHIWTKVTKNKSVVICLLKKRKTGITINCSVLSYHQTPLNLTHLKNVMCTQSTVSKY